MRAVVLLVLTSIFVAACDTALDPQIAGLGLTATDSCAVSAVVVTPSLDTLPVGQTLAPSAQVQSCLASQDSGVTWSSSDSTIASVDASSGFVQAIRAGKATIKASAVAEPTVSGSLVVVVSQ
jgi:uncharacterized protein YjdB